MCADKVVAVNRDYFYEDIDIFVNKFAQKATFNVFYLDFKIWENNNVFRALKS